MGVTHETSELKYSTSTTQAAAEAAATRVAALASAAAATLMRDRIDSNEE